MTPIVLGLLKYQPRISFSLLFTRSTCSSLKIAELIMWKSSLENGNFIKTSKQLANFAASRFPHHLYQTIRGCMYILCLTALEHIQDSMQASKHFQSVSNWTNTGV